MIYYQVVSTLYGDRYKVTLDGEELVMTQDEFRDLQASEKLGHLCTTGVKVVKGEHCDNIDCKSNCGKNK